MTKVHELLGLIISLKADCRLLTAHDVSLCIYDFFDNGRKSGLSQVCESLLKKCENEILQGMAQEVLKMMSMIYKYTSKQFIVFCFMSLDKSS